VRRHEQSLKLIDNIIATHLTHWGDEKTSKISSNLFYKLYKYVIFKSPESYYRSENKANTVKFVEKLKQINPTGYDRFTFCHNVKLLNAHQRFYCQLGILRLNRIEIQRPLSV
jgi:hypothetical protein